jgi:hypothetical protein
MVCHSDEGRIPSVNEILRLRCTSLRMTKGLLSLCVPLCFLCETLCNKMYREILRLRCTPLRMTRRAKRSDIILLSQLHTRFVILTKEESLV